ncbi:hypothetical protein B0H17DRAFT_1175418 [Mycena rosella]|uniref:Uncharacterized protein n=1 Tax=Mycena rosella TaxID=1033263 RepID=A0AAD7GTH0_MYCRO|nr:hypothetical protein B0H17DRAFT_1175418 [Mycena rosella]
MNVHTFLRGGEAFKGLRIGITGKERSQEKAKPLLKWDRTKCSRREGAKEELCVSPVRRIRCKPSVSMFGIHDDTTSVRAGWPDPNVKGRWTHRSMTADEKEDLPPSSASHIAQDNLDPGEVWARVEACQKCIVESTAMAIQLQVSDEGYNWDLFMANAECCASGSVTGVDQANKPASSRHSSGIGRPASSDFESIRFGFKRLCRTRASRSTGLGRHSSTLTLLVYIRPPPTRYHPATNDVCSRLPPAAIDGPRCCNTT